MRLQTIKTPLGKALVVLTPAEGEGQADANDGNLGRWQVATGQSDTFSAEEVAAMLKPRRCPVGRQEGSVFVRPI